MRSRVLMGEVVYAVQDAPLAAVGLSLVQKVSDTPWHLPALGLTEPLQPPAVGKLERVVVQRLQDEYRCVPVHPDSTVQYARPNRHRKKQLSWTVKPCVMLHYCRVARGSCGGVQCAVCMHRVCCMSRALSDEMQRMPVYSTQQQRRGLRSYPAPTSSTCLGLWKRMREYSSGPMFSTPICMSYRGCTAARNAES